MLNNAIRTNGAILITSVNIIVNNLHDSDEDELNMIRTIHFTMSRIFGTFFIDIFEKG